MTSPAQAPPVSSRAAALIHRSSAACGAAVIRGGEIAWTATRGGGQDLLFQAGSISKPVAALTALELVARGAADLDADVNDLLRSWHLPGAAGVTLRDLLGHTAGTGVSFLPGYPQGGDIPDLLQSLGGMAPATTAAVRADEAMKGRFRYSGGGYAVVQQLIADLTGQPFAHAARELVLEPLGMTASTFEQPLPAARQPGAARPDWHVYPEAAAAGLWSTPADLARLICAVQAAVAGRELPAGLPGLYSSAARLLVTPSAQLPGRGEWMVLPLLGVRPPDTFGLGMFLTGSDWFSHTGGAKSFVSMLAGSVSEGSGAVVMVAGNSPRFMIRLMVAISAEERWAGFRVRGPARLRAAAVPLRRVRN